MRQHFMQSGSLFLADIPATIGQGICASLLISNGVYRFAYVNSATGTPLRIIIPFGLAKSEPCKVSWIRLSKCTSACLHFLLTS